MRKLKSLFKKFILLCFFLFCFVSFYKGSSFLIKDLLSYQSREGFAIAFSIGVLALIFFGYRYLAFSCYKFDTFIINLEYYFNILEKVKEMQINQISDESLSGVEHINDIGCFIEDYIIYKSRKDGYPSSMALKILPRVERINHDVYYHFNKLLID